MANTELTDYLKSVFDQLHQKSESVASEVPEPIDADLNNNLDITEIKSEDSPSVEARKERTFSDAKFANDEDDDEQDELMNVAQVNQSTPVHEIESVQLNETSSIHTTTQVEVHSPVSETQDTFLSGLKEVLLQRGTYEPTESDKIENSVSPDVTQNQSQQESIPKLADDPSLGSDDKSLDIKDEEQTIDTMEPPIHTIKENQPELVQQIIEMKELLEPSAEQREIKTEPVQLTIPESPVLEVSTLEPPTPEAIAESNRISRSDWNLPTNEQNILDQLEKTSVESGIESTADEEETRDTVPEPESTRPHFQRAVSENPLSPRDRDLLSRSVSTLTNVKIGSFTEEKEVSRSRVTELRKLWKDRVIQNKS